MTRGAGRDLEVRQRAAPWPREPRTLVDALERAARAFPGRGVGLLDGRGRPGERRSYPELLERARDGARRLAALGLEPGAPFLVALPTSWEFLELWFGAVLLGAWPLAVSPPAGIGSSEYQLRRIEDLLGQLDAPRLACSASVRADAAALGLERLVRASLTPEEVAASSPRALAPREFAPEETAFLQLTSGSTGRSRAVIVTHGAAVHNPLASDEAIGAPHGAPAHEWVETMVSWLPLYHDMGLVGCLLFPLVAGFDLWLASPRTFLGRPGTWLAQLGAHGPAISAAPNFAYQTCVERVAPDELVGADLSHWRAALCGAEMIRPETMRDFAARFAPLGFSPRALRPCYGMAEATLALTFDRLGRGVRTRPMPMALPGPASGGPAEPSTVSAGSEVVNVGSAVMDTELRIAAPDGAALPEGRVGEVLARGPGIARGYLRDPEGTRESFQDGWLKTGDLGFLHEGELFLTGRTKDLLIVRGSNLMPHELEWLAESVTGGGGATRSGAFSVPGRDGEQAVLAVEIEDAGAERLAELEREIRLRIAHALSIPLADLAFVRRGRLPKTTSGKVQRRELRRRYLAGELERVTPAVPS